MAIYEYACNDCKLLIEKDFPFYKPKDKIKCPECGSRIEQNWAGRTVNVQFKGAGWTGKNKNTGRNMHGGSDEVNLNLQQGCKDRMDTGWHHYSRMTPPKILTDNARKLSERELESRLKLSKKQTQTNYDKSGLSPYKKRRPSNI